MTVELNYLTRGQMRYLTASGFETVRSGQLVAFWGAFPHRVVAVEESPFIYCIYISLARFLKWGLPGVMTNRIMRGELAVDDDPDNGVMDRLLFPRWHNDASHASQRADYRASLLEIEGRLRRMALSLERAPDHESSRAGRLYESETAYVERMMSYIVEHYADDITAEDVAHESGLHAKYASQLFKKTLGTTVLSFMNEYRLAQAQRLLTTTDINVTNVAFQSGFTSVRRLYEIFQQTYGKSPSEYRREFR